MPSWDYDECTDSSVSKEIVVAEEDIDYTKGLVRNVAIGFVLAFAGSTALCFVALRELGTSLAIAVVLM